MDVRGSGRSKEERERGDDENEEVGVALVEKAEKLRWRMHDGLERRDVWTSLENIILFTLAKKMANKVVMVYRFVGFAIGSTLFFHFCGCERGCQDFSNMH